MVVLQVRAVVVAARSHKIDVNPSMPIISIIIPVLNEAESLQPFLLALQQSRRRRCEIIVVDGGSNDETESVASGLADQVITSEAGRARQMNKGAAEANGNILLFLHADTFLPGNFEDVMIDGLNQYDRVWGRFNVRLSGSKLMFRIIEWFMNNRSKLTGIATGDQAIFIRTETFKTMGGFADIDLMEDIDISHRLKKISLPLCLDSKVKTSSRRWEEYGIWATILLMWKLRFAYYQGQDPALLKRKYL